MVKFTLAAILAASVAAPAFGAAISFDRIESREVAPSSEDLVGRAVAEIMSNVFTREELSEVLGRDVEEFTARDLSELMSREYDVDESLITRDLLDASELESRAPLFRWIKKKLGFGKKHEQVEGGGEPQARDFDEDSLDARDFDEDSLDARDFDEDMFEARAETPAPAPKQPNIIEKFLNLFRNKNHAGAKAAAAAKKNGGEAPAPGAPAAPAAEAAPATRDFLDIPEERFYDDEEMFERDFDEDVYERDLEEEMYERDYDVEEMFERYFDEELLERVYEDVLERAYEFDELD